MNHLDDRISNLLSAVRALLKEIPDAELLTEYAVFYHDYTLIVDAVIRKSGELLAVFETKPYIRRLQITEIRTIPIVDNPIAKYTILTNGLQIYVLDQFTKKTTDIKSPEGLIDLIFRLLSPEQVDLKKREIAQVIEQEKDAFLYENHGLRWQDQIQEQLSFQKIYNLLRYDRDGQYFRLGSDIRSEDNFENQLFNILLEDVRKDQKIYRYAVLDTMFATINYQSIRMNGIAGMNDPSELDYADRYFDQQFSIFSDSQEMKAANRRFITCCSELEDTLNQWRLYGDDCKGACLVFGIQQSDYSAGMRVKKISYGKKTGNNVFHPELELIKRLLAAVSRLTDQSLQFKSLGIWKHFFKPFEYTEEKEVRVLLVLSNDNFIKGSMQPIKKKWNLTNSHKIVAPYIQIPLQDEVLPIRLESITLGSKCPEKALNLVQLEIMLEENGLGNIKVNHSQISNYR